eukprot:TRINITY_DN55906_c0_g1_i1.p2 TRINITY_DN55906_c0_g1~~TRINITY_DN55906_c0_g1_i1.p2  ORF type:complete len:292 (+),score=86.21 TRINITY_DN55906_c0_g1_i1:83-958(+)
MRSAARMRLQVLLRSCARGASSAAASPLAWAKEAEGRWEEARVSVNGVELLCARNGSGGPAVLCMPGALGTAATDFAPQLTGFDDSYQVVSFDPRGYGRSRPPSRTFPDGFYRTDAVDAAELMRALGHQRYHVIGWSDGAISACILAADFPERVGKLVMFGGNAYLTEKDAAAFEKHRDVERNWSQRMKDTHRPTYGDELQPMWDAATDAWIRIVRERGGDVCMREARALRCPTLVVHGAKDPICLAEHPKWFCDNIPGAEYLEFAEGKHNLHIRFAAEFNAAVRSFFARA